MSKSMLVYFDEWAKIVKEAELSIKSDCPLLEDEAIIFISENLQRVVKENKTLKKCLREIQSMCVDEIEEGNRLDADSIVDNIYNSCGIKVR